MNDASLLRAHTAAVSGEGFAGFSGVVSGISYANRHGVRAFFWLNGDLLLTASRTTLDGATVDADAVGINFVGTATDRDGNGGSAARARHVD